MLADDVDLAALRAQTKSLAELLRAEVPKHARTQRALALDADTPTGIATLWESVGWSELMIKCELESPELATSEQRIADRMEEYRSWGDGFELTPNDLPKRRRLVQDDGNGVAFLFTDETSGKVDAKVLGVQADTGKIGEAADSYVRWCSNAILRGIFARWYNVDVTVKPARALEKLGHCPWPLLTQAARELAPDVYCVPPPDYSANSPQRKGRYQLAYRSPQKLVAFLEAVELEQIELAGDPSDFLECNCPASKLFKDTDRLRWLPTAPNTKLGVGSFADEPAIVVEAKGKTKIYVNPRSIERLKPIRDARLNE